MSFVKKVITAVKLVFLSLCPYKLLIINLFPGFLLGIVTAENDVCVLVNLFFKRMLLFGNLLGFFNIGIVLTVDIVRLACFKKIVFGLGNNECRTRRRAYVLVFFRCFCVIFFVFVNFFRVQSLRYLLR